MLISTTTMTFYTRPILDALETISQIGFDAVEIWADHAWDPKKGATAHAIHGTLQHLQLKATVHCPIMDINIASPNRGIREESIRQNFASIDLAKEIEANLVVLHPGNLFSTREALEDHWALQVKAIKEIVTYGEKQGIFVAVENMDADKDIVTVKNEHHLRKLFQDAQIKNGLITLDTTHLRTTRKVLDFIAEVGTSIAHLHLSDATSDRMHLPLGEGTMNLASIVQALRQSGYQGICSLECFIPNQNLSLLQLQLEKAKSLWD